MEMCGTNHTSPAWQCVSLEENLVAIVVDILAAAAYAVSLILGLPTNGFILWLILRRGREKIASDIFPINQIVIEILLSLSGVCYFLDHYLSLSTFWVLSLFINIIFLVMRPLVQSFICLEQYLATVHPVIFLRYKSPRYKGACCCVCWLLVIALSTVNIVSDLQSTFLFMTAVLYQISLLFMAFCCFSVLRALRRPGPGEGQRHQHRGNSTKRRAFNLILTNMVYTSVCQIPVAVLSSMGSIIPNSMFFAISYAATFIFVLTGFFPAILYLYRVGKLYTILHFR